MSDPNYRGLLRGIGAHADPVAGLAHVPAEAAGKKLHGFPHSIWQLVGHINCCMEYELDRIAGKRPVYLEPVDSFPKQVAPSSDEEWRDARQALQDGIARLAALADGNEAVLNAPVEVLHPSEKETSASARDVLWQVLVHNSYHTGQIVLMLQGLGLWPPNTGSDT
jgi:uncharacterized damage-inducible protein DinB